jgi:hypothetical protein
MVSNFASGGEFAEKFPYHIAEDSLESIFQTLKGSHFL